MTKGISGMQEKEITNLLNEKRFDKNKKSLKQILLSYFEKKQMKGLDLQKIKEEFSDIELNMKDAKTSFETILEIQKKLSKIYKKLNEKRDEKENEKKKS